MGVYKEFRKGIGCFGVEVIDCCVFYELGFRIIILGFFRSSKFLKLLKYFFRFLKCFLMVMFIFKD